MSDAETVAAPAFGAFQPSRSGPFVYWEGLCQIHAPFLSHTPLDGWARIHLLGCVGPVAVRRIEEWVFTCFSSTP